MEFHQFVEISLIVVDYLKPDESLSGNTTEMSGKLQSLFKLLLGNNQSTLNLKCAKSQISSASFCALNIEIQSASFSVGRDAYPEYRSLCCWR